MTKEGKITKGIVPGANLLKKSNFCNKSPCKFKPKKADKAKQKVIDVVLVKLLTNGIKPKIFNNKIVTNIVIK
jgi:hypothetical protein